MSTCKDCLHNEVCEWVRIPPDAEKECSDFKDITKYVEVVRCNNCKYYHTDICSMSYMDREENMPHYWARTNDFCSYGERKENE